MKKIKTAAAWSSERHLAALAVPKEVRARQEFIIQRDLRKRDKEDRLMLQKIKAAEAEIIKIGGMTAYTKSQQREIPAISLRQVLVEKEEFLAKLGENQPHNRSKT